MKERARLRNAMLSLSGRDIGDLPPVADPAACPGRDFRYFCETYFGQTFHLKWSDDHLKVIAKIEQAVLDGGLFAMAMPRVGKTSPLRGGVPVGAAVRAPRVRALIGSDEEHAAGMLESIKAELENSEILGGDFPEVCHPIRSLEGIHQRASGQLYQGKQTHIGWTAREIVLPTIPGSGGVGRHHPRRRDHRPHPRHEAQACRRRERPPVAGADRRPADRRERPFAVAVPNRERILAGAILGMAGPGRKIAGLMTLTVVRPTIWPTASSTATSTRSGRASGPRWCTRSPRDRSGPSTPACGPRAPADRGEHRRCHGVLQASTGRRWTPGGHRLAGAVQPRRAVGRAARDEPAAAERGRRSSPSTRTSRCRRSRSPTTC